MLHKGWGMRNDDVEQGNGTASGVGAAARRVRSDVSDLGRALAREREDVMRSVSGFVKDRPLAALGIAFGVGYVLGGGLFSRTTGRLLGVGVRLASLALLRSLLGDVADEFAES